VTADGGLRRILPPPRRRPGLLAVLVRWRAELLVVGAVAGAWHWGGGAAVGVAAATAGVLTLLVEPVRTIVRDAVQSVVCMHRVRSGLVQAGVADRKGRIPWVVRAWCRGDVVLVHLWLISGTTVADIRSSCSVIATSAGAAKVEVHQRSLRQDRAILAVYRPRWGWPTR
jgi:hypothetical protein